MKPTQRKILADLGKLWNEHPTMSFGNLILVACGPTPDLLTKSDSEIAKNLRDLL